MVWIVTWLLISTHIVTCPNNKAYVDDYGITHIPQSLTCQLCWDRDTSSYRKEFNSRCDLDNFLKNMPTGENGMFYTNTDYCADVKIDSVDVWLGN